METLGPKHVQAFLDRRPYDLRVRHFAEDTSTSDLAAKAISCELGQIAKSMCFLAGGAPVLVVASGDQRVSDAKLAKHLGVGRKKVKIATPEQCITIFGYAPGGVSPVAHRTDGITILIDETLSRWDIVHAAAGTHRDNFSLTFEQLVDITGGTVLDCVRNKTTSFD